MTEAVEIRRATKPDLGLIDAALRRLARHLGDPYCVSEADIAEAVFGAAPSVCVEIAGRPDGECIGILTASPAFSTIQSGPGLFVNDLWVDAEVRGQGVARRLMAAACRDATALWGQVRFVRLMAHGHNTAAWDFYERMGFEKMDEMGLLTLTGAAFDRLERTE